MNRHIHTDKDHKDIHGLILDEEEARKLAPSTIFKRISNDVSIGFNSGNRRMIFLKLKLNAQTLHIALPTVVVAVDGEREIWDEKNVSEES